MSELHQFLNEHRNTVHREAMMRHQLMHDIHLAFASYRRRIQIYEPEVDSFGYDIILDDLARTQRIQLKTTLSTSTTAKWEIHKILLRPDIHHLNRLPFCPDSGGNGYMGGVILITAHVDGNSIKYSYSYTDVLVICAIVAGICPPSSSAQRRSVQTTFTELTRPDYKPGKITIRPSCFWTFNNLRPVLALAGFDLGYHVPTRHILMEAVGRPELRTSPEDGEIRPRPSSVPLANETIRKMFSDDRRS